MKLYDFEITQINGEAFESSLLKGKKVMIVNTASKCGLTPQYAALEDLFQHTERNEFMILGFPSNDFLKQEPGTNEEIAEFCQVNYGVSFPMMGKIKVKGDDKHPLYQWLLIESKKKGGPSEVEWNFHKFLIDEKGDFVKSISPKTQPLDEEILDWINDK